MRCRFCGKRLALLRKLTDGEFCSSSHRKQFLEEEHKLAVARLIDERHRAGILTPPASRAAAHAGDPQANHPAGFRTEEFTVRAGSRSPAGQPSALEQPPQVCLVERTGRMGCSLHSLGVSSIATLPHEPGLSAGSAPAATGDESAAPIQPQAGLRAGALSVEAAPLLPRQTDLLSPSGPEPKAAGRSAIRGQKTSVFLKLARPILPGPVDPAAARMAESSLPIAGTVTPAAPGCRETAAIEPAVMRTAAAGLGPRHAGLRTTGMDVESLPVSEIIVDPRLASEIGLAGPAPAAAGPSIQRLRVSAEAFEATLTQPAGTSGWAQSGLRQAQAGIDPWRHVPSRPEIAKPRQPELETGAFQRRAAFPSPPVPPAALPGSTTVFAVGAPVPEPPAATPPAAAPGPLAVLAATGMPSESGRLQTSVILSPLVVAAGAPDPAAASRREAPSPEAAPLSPCPPAPDWKLPLPEVAAPSGTARLVAFGWLPALRVQSDQRPKSPASLETARKPLLTRLCLEPVEWSPAAELAGRGALAVLAGPWMAASRFWSQAPADLRWLSLALPALLLAALISTTGWLPSRTPDATAQAGVQRSRQVREIVGHGWDSLKRGIGSRAAVNVQDDFRSGLADWEGQGNWSKGWDYDAAGFVLTGPLALYRPSLELSDYQFEFLGQIEKKSLNWVFRAADYKNYYVMKIVLATSGPLPKAALVRYAVIAGKPDQVVQRTLPMEVRGDTFFRIRTQVRGANFTTLVQDHVVDSWSDDRLTQGGVGFFSEKGERARLRWVEVSHQYDTLGRLCALLAPYHMQSANGGLSQP